MCDNGHIYVRFMKAILKQNPLPYSNPPCTKPTYLVLT